MVVIGLMGVNISDRAEIQLVGEMHENLAALNHIIEGVAREDYELIERKANHLRTSASSMMELDLASVGLDRQRDAKFDGHLKDLENAAGAIRTAAVQGDSGAVLLGVQQAFDQGCVPCHDDFRERHSERTPPVLFMRNILSSVESMNRGLAMNDFTLIAREARSITAIGRVFMWSQVVEAMFDIVDPDERARFRDFLRQLDSHASRVEGAALDRNSKAVTAAMRNMFEDGCLPCHQRFRKEK